MASWEVYSTADGFIRRSSYTPSGIHEVSTNISSVSDRRMAAVNEFSMEDVERERARYRPPDAVSAPVSQPLVTNVEATGDTVVDTTKVTPNLAGVPLSTIWDDLPDDDKKATMLGLSNWMSTFDPETQAKLMERWASEVGENVPAPTKVIQDYGDVLGVTEGQGSMGIPEDGPAPVYDPFAELGWRDIYTGYVNQMGGLDSPGKYKHVIEQGLANNPLLRTAQTQFLVQGDWGIEPEDPDLGTYHRAGLDLNFPSDRSERSPYWEFLDTYTPLSGRELISTIDSVIENINKPAGAIEGDSLSPEDYSSAQMRQLRWRNRFGIGTDAQQSQQQLVALPILEHTSPAMKNEIASVLSTLHSNWLVSENRNEEDNWLEYARDRKFFGLVPDDVLQGGSG